MISVEKLVLKAKCSYNRHQIRHLSQSCKHLRNDGVGIVAETDYIFSVSQLARDFVDRIASSGIPFSLINTSIPFLKKPSITQKELSHYHSLECRILDQKHIIHFSTIRTGTEKRFCNATTPFWEFQSGMEEYRPGIFKGTDVVIAYSDFLKDYFESIVPTGVKVLKFHYPCCPLSLKSFPRDEILQKHGIKPDSFVVFFNFDFNSCYERKNPEAIIEAFAKAFASNSHETVLVFKTSHAENHHSERERLQELVRKFGISTKTTFIDSYLARDEVLALTASSNAYISLHRGEGLGMGMLEALSLGVPVIATAWGGNTDFIRQDTAFPVPYRLVPAKTNFAAYTHVSEWAEPDTDAAASFLRQLYEKPEIGKVKSATAATFLNDYFSLGDFKSDLNSFLDI